MTRVTSRVNTDPNTGQEIITWQVDVCGATQDDLPDITSELEKEHGSLVPVLLGELGIYRHVNREELILKEKSS
jgi:hypothetical protein